MRPSLIIAVAASLFAGSALAQAPSPANQSGPALLLIPQDEQASPAEQSADPRLQSQDAVPTAPHAGPSSFTADDAKAKFEERGFSEITELKKNDDGVWLCKAQRDGDSFEVALDFEGNVFFRAAS